MTSPKYSLEVRYVDTCLVDYLSDHYCRKNECMVGVGPMGQDEENAAEDIYRAFVFQHGEKIPKDILDDNRPELLKACQTAAEGVDWRTIDSDGDRISLKTGVDEIDSDNVSDSQAWFVLTWKETRCSA